MKHFLLVGTPSSSQWSSILRRALSPLGELRIASEADAPREIARKSYDAIILDAGAVRDVNTLTSLLRQGHPHARVIVATASPTWRRAREALRAGAADYIRKSLDEQELQAAIQAALLVTPPALPKSKRR